ncbi:hypothetical protein BC937DRAFT_94153, partial [Endogone sp. FLAS-F59071]
MYRHRPQKPQRTERTERYNIDGTLHHDEPIAKKWNLKEIIQDPEKQKQATLEAQAFVKAATKPTEADQKDEEDHGPLWSETAEEIFFSRKHKGLAASVVERGSAVYYEFKAWAQMEGWPMSVMCISTIAHFSKCPSAQNS